MLRFSLRTLAGAVTTIGLACAALINASPWISSLSWTATVLGLALAAVAAALSTSSRRGFWTGFAIVGWVFTVITNSPMFGDLQTSLFTTALLQRAAMAMPQAQDTLPLPSTSVYPNPPYTPTTSYVVQATSPSAPVYQPPATSSTPTYSPPPAPTALAPTDRYADYYNRQQQAPAIVAYPVTTYTPYVAPVASQFRESFVQIGQALWVLVLAFAGGLLGQFIVARNRTRAEHSAAS